MKSFFIFLCLLNGIVTFGQAPDWSFNPRVYNFSMSFTAALNVNGNKLTNENDVVAAFVNDEIRGVGNVSYNANSDKYVVFFNVYANTFGENINFKVYDSTNDTVVNITKTIPFQGNTFVGNVFQSYSIANPTLSNQASLDAFSFQGITEISQSKGSTTYDFVLPSGTDISSLVPIFSIPSNATLFKGFVRQESGGSSQDFSSSITYTVLSADETVKKNYTISVSVSGGSGNITATLQSSNNSLTNNNIIDISVVLNTSVIAIEKEDFTLVNSVVKSITKQNDLLYSIEIVPINQGSISVTIDEDTLQDANGNINTTSNKLSFIYDNIQPHITNIVRNNPTDEVTDSNTLIFTVTFNEDVQNVTASDFESVSGAQINLTKQTDRIYDITITNIDDYVGAVSLYLKSNNTIIDNASNTVRITNSIDF
jgi:DNA-directed RNA polymerase subunit L